MPDTGLPEPFVFKEGCLPDAALPEGIACPVLTVVFVNAPKALVHINVAHVLVHTGAHATLNLALR